MKSPVGSELLAACKIVGWPAAGSPWTALSTKPGPYSLLKIWTQALPHCVVDALAGSVAAVLRPPATVSVAAAASTLVLMDMSSSFRETTTVPRARRLCWHKDQALAGASAPAATGWRATSCIPGVVRRDRSAAVRGQERGQRGERFVGSFLCDPVGAAGDDQGLHVVRGELHRGRDLFAQAVLAADGQDGQGQPPFLALLVLRDRGLQRAVDREAGVQRLGTGGQGIDVMLDGVAWQFLGGLGGELPAEVDVFPPLGELVVDLGEPVEREVPQRVVQAVGREQGR